MKKILITGVCGMIGSHLADRLLYKGHEVIGVDNLSVGKIGNIEHNLANKRFKFYKADILDLQKFNKIGKGIDVLVHLAASKKISENEPSLHLLKNNVTGTENALIVAGKNKAKFIFGSTSDVYGTSKDIPFREDGDVVQGAPTVKRWAYAASKLYCEHLALAYYKDHDLPVVVLRYFGCFSSRSSSTWTGGHVPLFIDAILKGRDIIIHGDGKQTRSMGYVDDVVRGTILAIEKQKAVGQIINIGNDEEMSVVDTARYLIKLSGKSGKKLKFVPHKKVFGGYREIMRRVPDLTKAKKILGYSPKIGVIEALKIAYEDSRTKETAG